MFKSAIWECEWCGRQSPIGWFQSLFSFALPRFCPPTSTVAGWPNPACHLAHELALRIAERRTKDVFDATMKKLHGRGLGELRSFHEVIDISHSAKSIRKGKSKKD